MLFEKLKKVPLLCRPAHRENLSDLAKVCTKTIEMIWRTLEV